MSAAAKLTCTLSKLIRWLITLVHGNDPWGLVANTKWWYVQPPEGKGPPESWSMLPSVPEGESSGSQLVPGEEKLCPLSAHPGWKMLQLKLTPGEGRYSNSHHSSGCVTPMSEQGRCWYPTHHCLWLCNWAPRQQQLPRKPLQCASEGVWACTHLMRTSPAVTPSLGLHVQWNPFAWWALCACSWWQQGLWTSAGAENPLPCEQGKNPG